MGEGPPQKGRRRLPEAHHATARASDFGVARTAGGVLGFVSTQRPVVLVDEPGHWLARIQREQCLEAGLCVVVPFGDFMKDPAESIQKHAESLDTNSALDHVVDWAIKENVGAERDLAAYLWTAYLERD